MARSRLDIEYEHASLPFITRKKSHHKQNVCIYLLRCYISGNFSSCINAATATPNQVGKPSDSL